MITKNRLLLVVSNKERLNKACRYEAIKAINSADLAAKIWALNRTPVMVRSMLTDEDEKKYPILEIPDAILDFPDTEEFIKFSHLNGYESGEFMTGEVYDTQHDDCFLCRIGNLGGTNKPVWVYNKNVEKEADVIIYESRHFFIVPEYGSIRRGYLMICPKEHILSMAGLPDGYFAEYYQVEKDIEYILKSTYGFDRPVSFFEHGSDPNGKSSHKRSVVHAHTHLCWGFELEQKYLDMVQMKIYDDLREARGGKYFSYRKNADGLLYLVKDPDVYVQRQFPRQIMAEQLGLAPGQYNWRKEGFEENVTATLYRVHKFLADNYDELPERIRQNVEGFVEGYALREGYRKA